MFRYILALIALVCVSDASQAGWRPFARVRERTVHRERHAVRNVVFPRLTAAPSSACGPAGCAVPAPAAVPVPPKPAPKAAPAKK